MDKKRGFNLFLMLIIISSMLVACGGNESIEKKLTSGGIWLAQTKGKWDSYSYLMVFTPEGNVLWAGDPQATFEITDSTLTITSSQDDYVEKYAVSVAEDGNTIFLNNLDTSGNTVNETTTLTHYGEYKPTSLSSLNLENSFWDGNILSNAEEMTILAFTNSEAAFFVASKGTKNLATIFSIGDFTVTKDAVFITVEGNLIKFSVSVFNKDTIMLTSDGFDTLLLLQRMNPDIVESAFPTAPVRNNDEIIDGLTPGIWIMPAQENGGIAFLPDGTFIDGDTLELGTYEVLAEDNSLHMTLTSEDDWGNWDDILTITHPDDNTIALGSSLSGSILQLEKYVSYDATAINDINFAGNWYIFHELFITPEYQNQESGAYLLSGDDIHIVGNSVILSNYGNFTAYPFSEDILYLHSPIPGNNFVMVRATN